MLALYSPVFYVVYVMYTCVCLVVTYSFPALGLIYLYLQTQLSISRLTPSANDVQLV